MMMYIYLEEPRVPFYSIDHIEWWSNNSSRFPILARMVNDYLVKQLTSKDVEGIFSKGRPVVPSQKKNQMLVNCGNALIRDT